MNALALNESRFSPDHIIPYAAQIQVVHDEDTDQWNVQNGLFVIDSYPTRAEAIRHGKREAQGGVLCVYEQNEDVTTTHYWHPDAPTEQFHAVRTGSRIDYIRVE